MRRVEICRVGNVECQSRHSFFSFFFSTIFLSNSGIHGLPKHTIILFSNLEKLIVYPEHAILLFFSILSIFHDERSMASHVAQQLCARQLGHGAHSLDLIIDRLDQEDASILLGSLIKDRKDGVEDGVASLFREAFQESSALG
jgi:hypothetical protein